MTKPRVFVTRIILHEGLKIISAAAHAEVWQDELPPSHEVLEEKVKGIDGLLCLLTDRIDGPLMDTAGDSLKVISQMAVGYDNIDLAAATSHGIPVGHTPGVLTDATADFTWALLMAAARRVVEADRFTRQGRWKTWGPTLLLGPQVAGATLGIIGLGRIGQAVARRAGGFEMRILYHDTQRRAELEKTLSLHYVGLNQLLQESDFVTIHTWLSKETYHLFSEPQFKRMKPTAVLINTARGSIVDPLALSRALKEGWIAYAAVDVTDPEPIEMDSPLLGLDNLIITPHIASASLQARIKMATMAAENLVAGLKGERLPHCANPEVY
jgi:glyoxylate reductase